MKRPCECGRATVGGWPECGPCRLCWLWHNDERYRALWSGSPLPPVAGGPGSELAAILSAAGYEAVGCGCVIRAAEMDRWGVDGCRLRRAEIAGWLAEQRALRGWVDLLPGLWRMVKSGAIRWLNPLDPLGSLVDEAISRAEAKE